MSPDTTPPLRLILGLMTFGPNAAHGGRITSLDDFNACLDLFQHRGYNEVDTARLYVGGQQEAFTAEAHWKERGLKMATKWYPIMPGAFKADMIKAKLEESLRELKTDSVDIFYLHAVDRIVPFAETLEAVDELYKARKFKQLGLSNFSAFEVVTMYNLRGWVRPTIYQGVYNAISKSKSLHLVIMNI
jgi:aflatoxin B1 aldehyde reductase